MNAREQLGQLGERTSPEEALAFFDSLPVVRAEHVTGRWRGWEIATCHPLDGLLVRTGWYGKQFDDVDRVHPLLFTTADGDVVPADPRGWMKGAITQTSAHGARLRNVEHRGVVTAAMIYDDLPIIDIFRSVDASTLLGVMDFRAHPAPYFFVLERVS